MEFSKCAPTDCFQAAAWSIVFLLDLFFDSNKKIHWEVRNFFLCVCVCVSYDQKKKTNHTVNSKKYYLCYKDYRIIDSKSLHFVSEMFDSYHPGLSRPSRVFDQHNRGFIKYHNSRTNIYMPACFLTKMAAIGKNDGSEIEQNKTVGLYKWWYCLPNSSNAYTIPLNIIYTPHRSPQDW